MTVARNWCTSSMTVTVAAVVMVALMVACNLSVNALPRGGSAEELRHSVLSEVQGIVKDIVADALTAERERTTAAEAEAAQLRAQLGGTHNRSRRVVDGRFPLPKPNPILSTSPSCLQLFC